MASGTGTASLNFGADPGSNEASVTVTGQTSIAAGSKIVASVAYSATADHTVSDAAYAACLMGVSAGNISAGTGFTLYARSTQKLEGKFNINWNWV